MPKWPSIQMYTGDWLKDPALAVCDPATRGIWIDFLFVMHELDHCGVIAGTRDQLARLGRCSLVQLDHAICELSTSKTADVTERNGQVTVINRRMKREFKSRVDNKLRQQRYRCNAKETENVTPYSSSSSSSSSSNEDKEKKKTPKPPPGDGWTIPDALKRVDGFDKAWGEWMAFRRKMKSCKDWDAMFSKQLEFLSACPEVSVEILNQSMRNGWQGIFHAGKTQRANVSNVPSPKMTIADFSGNRGLFEQYKKLNPDDWE